MNLIFGFSLYYFRFVDRKTVLGRMAYSTTYFLGSILPLLYLDREPVTQAGIHNALILLGGIIVTIFIFTFFSKREGVNSVDHIDIQNLLISSILIAIDMCLLLNDRIPIRVKYTWLTLYTIVLMILLIVIMRDGKTYYINKSLML